ncbi:MAG: ABC transporter ATP-binding protein [Ignavibacteria bacterium]|nr:ABC transporter ATP-binding protein [Ignavibacteria bacterium]
MSFLATVNLSFSYKKEVPFFENICINFQRSDFVSIIGRNGSGKSTFVKLLVGVINNYSGNVIVKDRDIKEYKRKELATFMSYLPQHGLTIFKGMRIKDFLLLGRYPFKNFSDFSYSKIDKEIVNYALRLVELEKISNKYLNEISGGELQKVLITLSLVQINPLLELDEKILIIDEPLTFLDINHSFEIFTLLKKLNEEKKLTVIIITHDLNLALKFSDKTILFDDGKVVSYGRTKEVIQENILRKHFLIDSQIININNNYHIYFNSIINN